MTIITKAGMSINPAEHIGLARNISEKFYRWAKGARRLEGTLMDRDDFYGVAIEALVEAASRFDSSKGFAFSTFAVKTIEGKLKNAVAKEFSHRDMASFSLDEEVQDGDVETFSEVVPDPEDHWDGGIGPSKGGPPHGYMPAAVRGIDTKLTLETIDSILESDFLSGNERRVIIGIFYGKETQTEIAKSLGVTQQYVAQIQKRALRRILKALTTVFV